MTNKNPAEFLSLSNLLTLASVISHPFLSPTAIMLASPTLEAILRSVSHLSTLDALQAINAQAGASYYSFKAETGRYRHCAEVFDQVAYWAWNEAEKAEAASIPVPFRLAA